VGGRVSRRRRPGRGVRRVRWGGRDGRCLAMMHVVIFWPRDTKADIAHRLANRIGRCAIIFVILCIPNEDFGNLNMRLGVSFRVILRAFVAQIQYSHPRKVPRKHTSEPLCRFPTSLFGEHRFFWPRDTKADIAHRPVNRIGRCQPSATHRRFGQTCLFTIFPNISTTIRGSQFRENREKAGLCQKRGELPTASRCAVILVIVIFLAKRYKTRYRTSTCESTRSMWDDACCDFSGQEIQKPISHIDW